MGFRGMRWGMTTATGIGVAVIASAIFYSSAVLAATTEERWEELREQAGAYRPIPLPEWLAAKVGPMLKRHGVDADLAPLGALLLGSKRYNNKKILIWKAYYGGQHYENRVLLQHPWKDPNALPRAYMILEKVSPHGPQEFTCVVEVISNEKDPYTRESIPYLKEVECLP